MQVLTAAQLEDSYRQKWEIQVKIFYLQIQNFNITTSTNHFMLTVDFVTQKNFAQNAEVVRSEMEFEIEKIMTPHDCNSKYYLKFRSEFKGEN